MQKTVGRSRRVKIFAPLDETDPVLSDIIRASPAALSTGDTRLAAWLEENSYRRKTFKQYGPDGDIEEMADPDGCRSSGMSEAGQSSGSGASSSGAFQDLCPPASKPANGQTLWKEPSPDETEAKDVHAAARRSLESSRSMGRTEAEFPRSPRSKQKSSRIRKLFY